MNPLRDSALSCRLFRLEFDVLLKLYLLLYSSLSTGFHFRGGIQRYQVQYVRWLAIHNKSGWFFVFIAMLPMSHV